MLFHNMKLMRCWLQLFCVWMSTQVMAPPPKETGFYATLALRNGGDKIAS